MLYFKWNDESNPYFLFPVMHKRLCFGMAAPMKDTRLLKCIVICTVKHIQYRDMYHCNPTEFSSIKQSLNSTWHKAD